MTPNKQTLVLFPLRGDKVTRNGSLSLNSRKACQAMKPLLVCKEDFKPAQHTHYPTILGSKMSNRNFP